MTIRPTALRSVMSEAEYDAERDRLRELYGETVTDMIGRRDQALALLFARCGWTQEKLAKKEGKSQRHIGRILLFGRFLNFRPTGLNAENLPRNLTERRFRQLWSETDQNEDNERIRFGQILKLIEDRAAVIKPRAKPYGHQIKEKFGDGKWHSIDAIVDAIGEHDERDVIATLDSIRRHGYYGMNIESEPRGRQQRPHYRIFPLEKSVSSTELAEKLGPIVKDLKIEGRKNMATMVPAVVAMLAERLQRLLDEWTA